MDVASSRSRKMETLPVVLMERRNEPLIIKLLKVFKVLRAVFVLVISMRENNGETGNGS